MSLTRLAIWLGVLSAVYIAGEVSAFQYKGKVGIEARRFVQTPFDRRQTNADFSLFVAPEFFQDLSGGTSRLVFSPYGRIDQNDSKRSHFDIRELYWERIWRDWELAVGIKQIYWGVTETQHLVDFINQTDFIENFDGEDKLGQPMLHLTHIDSWGIMEAFVLPYFRERTFPGVNGRLRGPLVIDTDNPIYESNAKKYHFDWALHWSHTVGELDIGLSHFSGTHRVPILKLSPKMDGTQVLQPYYAQTERTGLTLQWTGENILWKLESVSEETLAERSFSAVGGFEYTSVGIFGSNYDLGTLAEYHFDDRDNHAPSPFENDLFVGVRLAFNDVQSTDALAGVIVDLDNQSTALFLEASRRIGKTMTVDIELRGFFKVPPDDQLYPFSSDDHALLSLQWHF